MLKREKTVILAARIVSLVFTPFSLPLVGLMALFAFSYLSLMPWAFKLQVLTLVYVFTILLPTVLIHLYRRHQGWNLIELGHKERRMVPYVISILCYFFCIYLMDLVHIPFHECHPLSSPVYSGGLRAGQCVVEDLYAYGSRRWGGRGLVRVWRVLRIQPRVVALSGVYPRRGAGFQPNDPASAHAAPGGGGILRRSGLLDTRTAVLVSEK